MATVTWINRKWITRQSWPNPSTGETFYAAGPQTGDITKVVLHGTEGGTFPDYRNYNDPTSPPGVFNPHLTYQPKNLETRQHIPLNRGARALVAPTSAPLNNVCGTVQIEVIGTCDPKNTTLLYYPAMTKTALWGLARLLRAIAVETKTVPMVSTVKWAIYDKSYGNTPNRLTYQQYLAYSGLLSHQNVPSNLHGDTGSLSLDSLALLASTNLAMPEGTVIKPGDTGGSVETLQMILIEEGYDIGTSGLDASFGPATQAAFAALRKDKGLPAGENWDAACNAWYSANNPFDVMLKAGVLPLVDVTPTPEPTPEPTPTPEDPMSGILETLLDEIRALNAKVDQVLTTGTTNEPVGLLPGEAQQVADLTVQAIKDHLSEPLGLLLKRTPPLTADETTAALIGPLGQALVDAVAQSDEAPALLMRAAAADPGDDTEFDTALLEEDSDLLPEGSPDEDEDLALDVETDKS